MGSTSKNIVKLLFVWYIIFFYMELHWKLQVLLVISHKMKVEFDNSIPEKKGSRIFSRKHVVVSKHHACQIKKMNLSGIVLR